MEWMTISTRMSLSHSDTQSKVENLSYEESSIKPNSTNNGENSLKEIICESHL